VCLRCIGNHRYCGQDCRYAGRLRTKRRAKKRYYASSKGKRQRSSWQRAKYAREKQNLSQQQNQGDQIQTQNPAGERVSSQATSAPQWSGGEASSKGESTLENTIHDAPRALKSVEKCRRCGRPITAIVLPITHRARRVPGRLQRVPRQPRGP
jgi:hypothetical protein